MKKVLITGTLGQDGANLAEYLLANTDHEIFGMIRRSANPNYVNIKACLGNPRFKLVFADLSDEISMNGIVRDIMPDYFVNFAANSFVGCSWDMPLQVFDTNTLGVIRCLEAIRKHKPTCRFYSAGSSEEFGDVEYSPQDIRHPIRARSPYGASKAAARHIVKVYRESYGLYAVHSILFNHEGTKRGEEFVTRKITQGIARIIRALKKGHKVEPIQLGNLDAKRDWSDSEDFVEGVWRMLNQEKFVNVSWDLFVDEVAQTKYYSKMVKEYVLASGETHTVREFIESAFKEAGIPSDVRWVKGEKPEDEYYYTELFNTKLVEVNPKFYRPADVELLIGDSTPIREELGWRPKTTFTELVRKMVRHDLSLSLI
jgi:GDPmannose 4,6-dehydratase